MSEGLGVEGKNWGFAHPFWLGVPRDQKKRKICEGRNCKK